MIGLIQKQKGQGQSTKNYYKFISLWHFIYNLLELMIRNK